MNFEKKVQELCEKFNKRVEEAILNGEAEIVKHDQYCHTIIVDGIKTDMWIGNDAKHYRVYRAKLFNSNFYFPELTINNKEECFIITARMGTEEIEAMEREIDRKRALLDKLKRG